MLATYKAKVVGLKANQGEFKDDNGRSIAFDSTKVYVELKMNGETARGVATQEYKIGKSGLFDKYKDIPLPFFAEIDVEKVTTGREEREEVTGFRPLEGFKDDIKPNLKAAS